MRVDFNNHRAVNIGDVVFSRKSDQMGVVLSKGFDFKMKFIIEIMFESGISTYFKGNGDGFSDIEDTSDAVDLSRFEGSSDPYGKVIQELRHIREGSRKHSTDRQAIG